MKDKKTIVITGASRGIGRALAEEFTSLGHQVIGCARAKDEKAPFTLSQVDVSHFEEVLQWAEETVKQFGAPDLLINNAGVVNDNAYLQEMSPEDFSRVIDVNVKGVFFSLRSFLPHMLKKGKGTIVNFSSGWGREGEKNVGAYCASKFAIEGLTQTLADELPKEVVPIALSPGVVATDMLFKCLPDVAKNAPTPEKWAKKAAPILLGLGPKDHGKSITIGKDSD